MFIIDDETVVVYNYDELNEVLSGVNTYYYIHMGDSFTLIGGILINPDKPLLVIDGTDPRDPTQTIRTLTDNDSSGPTGCICVNAASSMQITIQRINLMGRNYYGMPRISDVTGNEAVSVSYYNVTYTGPQITWHPRGLTRYIDCDITIETGFSPSNEIAEVCRLEIGGVTTIRHNNTTHPSFLFYNRGGTSMTILEDADVTITSMDDFVETQIELPFILRARSMFTLTTQWGMSRAARINSFLLEEDAKFHYTRMTNTGDPYALYINGPITLNRGADFLMVADFSGSTGALLNMATTAARLEFNDHLRFALYNSGTSAMGRPIYFSAETNFSFSCNQVNYWRAATPYPAAGTFSDVPPWQWHREEWGSFQMSGTLTNAATTVNATSLTPEEQAELPPFTDLIPSQAKVFSVGTLPLEVDPIIGDMRPITGTSAPVTDIQLSYTVDTGSREYTLVTGDDGRFSVAVEDFLPLDTPVDVAANLRFLLTIVHAESEGSLRIDSAPGLITFTFNPVYLSPVILPRTVPEEPVVIYDDREIRTEWDLFAAIDGPLRTASGLTLPESVVIIPAGETVPVTLDGEFRLVHTDEHESDVLFPVVWENDKGVLARITEPIRANETYSALLTWQVRPVETP